MINEPDSVTVMGRHIEVRFPKNSQFVRTNQNICICFEGHLRNICVKIPRPLGLHYNHYVSLSVRYQVLKMFITLEPHG